MTRGLLALLLAVWATAFPATAEVARVKSGEHANFTRLVIEAPGVMNWSLGRSTDGYELRLDSTDWQYDVEGVFDLIPRKRLASLAGDPQTGRLRLRIACACHAIPFEFRPGIIVVDLRDGPPPVGSAFERSLEEATQSVATSMSPRPPQRPDARERLRSGPATYNWLDRSIEARDPGPAEQTDSAISLPTGGESLDPLRQALLAQLSIGLSSGVIDLAEPGKEPDAAGTARQGNTWSRVILGEMPEATDNLAAGNVPPLTPAGKTCIPDERLALHDWGDAEDVSGKIGEIRQQLLGEFDRPDPEALVSAAKSLIHLGFGAEANQLLRAFPLDDPHPDTELLKSIARLVDGEADPQGPFVGMANCDSKAALWAVLSNDMSLGPGAVNDAALRRGFSALPPHLRLSLGPGLVDRFLAAGNPVAVTALRAAMGRNGESDQPSIAILDARINLSDGRADAAETRVAEVLVDPGQSTADAMIALVDAKTAQKASVDRNTVTTLEALLEEQARTARDPALRRALVLARFGAGDVAGAFLSLAEAEWVTEELWALLAERGSDSELLNHAVQAKGMRSPVAPATATRIAERLLALGFAEQALDWLGTPGADWDMSRQRIHAEALLATGDPKAAMAAVSGWPAPEAATILAQALNDLGQQDAAADAFDLAGIPERATTARGLAEDWVGLAESGPQDWQVAAQRLATARVPALDAGREGALGRGASLLGNSEEDRASVEALLRAVPMPSTDP